MENKTSRRKNIRKKYTTLCVVFNYTAARLESCNIILESKVEMVFLAAISG